MRVINLKMTLLTKEIKASIIDHWINLKTFKIQSTLIDIKVSNLLYKIKILFHHSLIINQLFQFLIQQVLITIKTQIKIMSIKR